MFLTLSHVVRTEKNVRSHYDRRRKVNRTVAAYRDSDGHEYRRAFEGPTSEPAPIPHPQLDD